MEKPVVMVFFPHWFSNSSFPAVCFLSKKYLLKDDSITLEGIQDDHLHPLLIKLLKNINEQFISTQNRIHSSIELSLKTLFII